MEPYRQPRNVGDDSWSGVGDGCDSDAGGITPAGAGEEAFDTILFRHTFPCSQQRCRNDGRFVRASPGHFVHLLLRPLPPATLDHGPSRGKEGIEWPNRNPD